MKYKYFCHITVIYWHIIIITELTNFILNNKLIYDVCKMTYFSVTATTAANNRLE